MKKIFRTSIFWLALVFLLRAYMKLFDSQLAGTIAGFFASSPQQVASATPIVTGTTIQDTVFEKLTAIDTEVDIVANKIVEMKAATDKEIQSTILNTATQTVVKLYYFNEKEDKKLPLEQQATANSLFPVVRSMPKTDNIIRDTLELLLQGALTDTEYQEGFTTEFVRAIRLSDMQLHPDGTLLLTFTKAAGASMGGSTFIHILTNSIIKTVLQFPQVTRVEIGPEALFQP